MNIATIVIVIVMILTRCGGCLPYWSAAAAAAAEAAAAAALSSGDMDRIRAEREKAEKHAAGLARIKAREAQDDTDFLERMVEAALAKHWSSTTHATY